MDATGDALLFITFSDMRNLYQKLLHFGEPSRICCSLRRTGIQPSMFISFNMPPTATHTSLCISFASSILSCT